MHEYEFRLVVCDSSPFLPLLQQLGYPMQEQDVYYLTPHFRCRNGKFETKQIESSKAVYHDGLWFRWVHSIETAHAFWSHATDLAFLHNIGNYQDPLTVEKRSVILLDKHAQLYTFQHSHDSFRMVFEWELGTFSQPKKHFHPARLLAALGKYKAIYNVFKGFSPPPYALKEEMTRRSVTCVDSIPEGDQYVYAHKLDGVFGLVYSYRDKIKEKWEGYECRVRKGVSLGDGLVFAAERLEDGKVHLLDVYQVQSHDTVKWSRRGILMDFLPTLRNVVGGYSVQTYASDVKCLVPNPSVKTDGLIIHDVMQDVIYKFKTNHTIDLVYDRGYFILPVGRIKCKEKGLEDGRVYELDVKDGSIVRRRDDRFRGNTSEQLINVLEQHGWNGPPIEPPPAKKRKA